MTIYSHTIDSLGENVENGLKAIAKAIKKANSKPNYIVNVVVAPGSNAEDIAAKVDETLKRVQTREGTLGN